MIYLEYRDGGSEKFWKLELAGSAFTVTYGKIGAAGQSQTKVFASEQEAREEADKQAAAKRKKGYADAPPPADSPAPTPSPTAKARREAAGPAEGPAPVADDGKPKAWHSGETAFDLARLADPTALADDPDDWEDEGDETADGAQHIPDGPAEERFRSACGARNLQLARALWRDAVAAGESRADWLSESLASCLESGYDPQDAPLVRWLLEEGAAFPAGDGRDRDVDDDDDWDDEVEPASDGDFYPENGPFGSHNGFANYFWREYAKDPDPARAIAIYEALPDAACAHLVGRLEQIVSQYRDFVPGESMRARRFKGFKQLPGATPLNRSFLGIEGGLDLPNEFWCYCLEALREQPTAARAREVWRGYLDESFAEAAALFGERLREFAACVRAGGEDKQNAREGFDFLPEGGCVGREFISFEIGVPNEYWVYVYLRGAERENPFDFTTDRIKGLTTRYMPDYAHLLGQEMEKLAAQGVFDGLFAWGGFLLKLEDSPERIGGYVIDPEAPARFAARMAELEERATQCRDGRLSGQALSVEAGDGLCGFLALLHGLFGPADEERAYRLLRSFLYGAASGEDEDRIVNMMCRWADDYPRMGYELALFHRDNLHPDQAEEARCKALDMGYAPAAGLEAELRAEAHVRERLARGPAESGDDTPAAAGFDRQAARQLWKGKSFEQVFSEADLYLVTDHIVARARPNGFVYIRFLVEGEVGYGEALDFVNGLLERGYAELSGGDSGGFALRVRFLIKPEYIPQMKSAKSRLGEAYPKSSCHAFFARAVRYPALRGKVADYAERALNRFDVYLDLWEDNTTVPGTFAVAALAFCGKEYLPLVSRYAAATDDEHTYLLPALMLPLVKHYGNDPDLAGAVFDIARNSNMDGRFRLPAELIWDADFVERLLEHGGAAEGDTRALEDFAIACEHLYGDKERVNLKKLQGLARTAPTRRERQIFADFYNVYLPAACVWSGDNLRASFDPIGPVDEGAQQEQERPLEHQECVIPLDEAARRGYDISEGFDEPLMLFLSPACILDHETIAYVRLQVGNIGRENSKPERERSCRVLMSNGPGCFRCGSWAVSTADMPFECGMLLYDGKKNGKPMLLFGELDALGLGSACKKRWPKSPADAETLRRKYLIRDAAPRRTDPAWLEADRYFEDNDRCGWFYSEWHSGMARRVLEGITPPFGALIYLCSRLMLVYLTERRGDAEALAGLAEELVDLQAEQAEVWRAKLEQARAAMA